MKRGNKSFFLNEMVFFGLYEDLVVDHLRLLGLGSFLYLDKRTGTGKWSDTKIL